MKRRHATLAAVPVTIAAAPGGRRVRRVEILAYTGKPMRPKLTPPMPHAIVVDLAGLEIPDRSLPILLDHDPQQRAGHFDRVAVDGAKLVATGQIRRSGKAAAEVVAAHDDGFPWRASVGMDLGKITTVAKGESVRVNNRTVSGPVHVARASKLNEISLLSMGADDDTSVRIAARYRGTPMRLKPKNKRKDQLARAGRTAAAAAVVDDRDEPLTDRQKAERVRAIRAVCTVGDQHFSEVETQALDEGWGVDQTAAAVLKARLPRGHGVSLRAGSGPARRRNPSQLLTASLLLHAGRDELSVAEFGEDVTQQAHDLRCHSLVDICASALSLEMVDAPSDRNAMIRASFSTTSLPTALGSYADKVTADAFRETPSVWEKICRIRPVTNFREHKIFRTLFVGNYEAVAPGGEIKHGHIQAGDDRTVQAGTKGKMFGITRADIINDDLGVFNDTGEALGRAAARTMNDDFVTVLLANVGNFFHADNGNLDTGGDSVFDAEALAARMAAMAKRRDSANRNIDLRARILLIPPELEFDATQVLKSVEVQRYTSSTNDNRPTGNPLAAALDLLSEARLSNTDAFPTGSATAWYLFGAPADGAINVALLNGRTTPVIEQSDADFNVLGIQFRGYHDYGFSLGEPAAADKSAGA